MKELVITRKYKNKNGTEGKEYIKVGYLFDMDGRQSILLKSHINFLAFQNAQGEIWVNVYDAKPKAQAKQNESPKQEEQQGVKLPEVPINKVAMEGKEYAQKWKEMTEGKQTQEPDNIITSEDDLPF